MIKLVIFDIDDTLYNEIDYVKSGYKVVAKYVENKYKVNDIYSKLINLFNISSKLVFNRLLDSLNIKYEKEDIIELVNLYRNHKPKIHLTQKTINLLNILKEKYKLAIISDGNYNEQLLKIDALNLNRYFDSIVLSDKYGDEYKKPNIKSFELLSNKLNIKFDEMIYIGDNPNKDFYVSKYGIKTVRYYNKKGIYYKDEYLNNIKEDYKIHNIDEIIGLIGSEI